MSVVGETCFITYAHKFVQYEFLLVVHATKFMIGFLVSPIKLHLPI